MFLRVPSSKTSSCKHDRLLSSIPWHHTPNIAINVPAATAVPITPATFGPIACINRKLDGSASVPTFCDTRAAIGTADTPAEPISGFTLPCVALHIILPNSTPAAVPNANATRPNATIFKVSRFKNASALVVAPTDVPRIYGYAIAADTGTGLIDGSIDLDLFYDSYTESCLNGVRYVNVYVLD